MAKNTIILYVRTIVLMCITLYTSRVVLKTLGETDFGVYNVVGGVVVLFAFINNAMSTATQRFLNFELGKGNKRGLSEVFCLSLFVHFFIAILIFILGETFGLWLINQKINIPVDRMYAANIVYQFSLVSCIINVLRIPYNASIIAYEKMSFYGIISILEGIFKLLIVVALLNYDGDKLILYACLILCVTVIIFLIYKFYCNSHFDCTHFHLVWDKKRVKQLISFSSWSLLGSASVVAINQGIGIIFNTFIGVIVNAAIGIANQINAAIYSFVSNFQTAFVPQIIKVYASGLMNEFHLLLRNTARYSFLLLYIISYPVYMECDFILNVWLTDVPDMTLSFTRLIICANLFDAMSGPLWSAVQAIGKIKLYQIIVSLLFFISLPICYIGLKMGVPVPYVFGVKILVSAVVFLYRLFYLKQKLNIDLWKFVYEVILRALFILLCSAGIAVITSQISHYCIINLIIYCISAVILAGFLGLHKKERERIWLYVNHKFRIHKV